MNKYISREAVVRYLKEYSEKECNSNSPYGMITSSVLNKAERAISELPVADVQPISQWIRCDEKLPEESKYVLIYYNTWSGNHIAIAKLTNYVFAFNNSGQSITMDRVTHWQPLPEPPKDGDR